MCKPRCEPSPPSGGKLRVSEIFRRHVDAFLEGRVVTPKQARVLRAVRDCRTAALGGHAEVCEDCGHSDVHYNSCRDRHCPTCQYQDQEEWIAARMERMLEVPHFHVVFTVPSQLRPLAMRNPALFYRVLMRSAARVLLRLGAQRLGGQVGVTVVLHTWDRRMLYHPHVHCIVTAGALDEDGGEWKKASLDYLFPVAVMRSFFSNLLRKDVLDQAREGHLDLECVSGGLRGLGRMLRSLRNRKWVVYCEKPFSGVSSLVSYLGRYTHRVAISDSRLLAVSDQAITFRARGDATVTVTPEEFIRRFLLHVLPKGFFKIRHYGLYASAHVNRNLPRARQAIVKAGIVPPPPDAPLPPVEEVPVPEEEVEFPRCPKCKVGILVTVTLPPSRPKGQARNVEYAGGRSDTS